MVDNNKKRVAFASTLLAIILLLYLIPFPWNGAIENGAVSLLLQLRGERHVGSDILLIYIGEEDIKALGGWPITRDYYSYIIHILNQQHVKTIGFDLWFDRPDIQYPEYDTTLAHFISQQNNVILPYLFNGVEATDSGYLRAEQVEYPIELLTQSARKLGYSNLGDRSAVPLMMVSGDTLAGSLGFELACHYLDYNDKKITVSGDRITIRSEQGERNHWPLDLLINHAGSGHMFRSYSFVELLQSYQQNPDSLQLGGTLAFIAVIAPGHCSLRPTPLAAALPASLIHLTVAENLITNSYLRLAPAFVGVILILLLGCMLLLLQTNKAIAWCTAASITVYYLVSYLVFIGFNTVLPLFYPVAATLGNAVLFIFLNWRQSQAHGDTQRLRLQQQLQSKQKQYEELEAKLAMLESTLDKEKEHTQQTTTLIGEIRALEKQIRDLQEYTATKKPLEFRAFPDIIHAPGSGMAPVLDLVSKVASDDIPVLILGETGTGKEVIARAIHFTGKRRQAPFVAVNCGALPDTLLESELFGHEKGSFTGAGSMRRGRFETAHKGTIFLDEVTETSAAFQVKLLRVLQEGVFERLGGEKSISVDVRVIAASSRALPDELAQGRFREDLFYRLNGFPIYLPPLRERKEDIPLLTGHFLKKHGYNTIRGFSEEAVFLMQNYSWPGNIRELENCVRRCAILVQSDMRTLIQQSDLPKELSRQAQTAVPYRSLEEQILELLRSLRFSHAAISKTAKALGNRDRGTITEYFRGICFEYLVSNDFHIPETVAKIAASKEKAVVQQVETKIREYLKNIYQSCQIPDSETLFKGLPKKYHGYLQQVIDHFRAMDTDTSKRFFAES